MYLQSLTNQQFVRLFNQVINRIYAALDGGTMFGIDLRTLAIIAPGWYNTYQTLNAERQRRFSL